MSVLEHLGLQLLRLELLCCTTLVTQQLLTMPLVLSKHVLLLLEASSTLRLLFRAPRTATHRQVFFTQIVHFDCFGVPP